MRPLVPPPAPEVRPDDDFVAAVARLLRVAADELTFTAVSGGVSSDIWRVQHDGRSWCAKRALPRLKVASLWEAPVSRNAEEVRWLRTVRPWVGERVAEVVAADETAGIALLAWYEPERFRNWKQELLAGRVNVTGAERLGNVLGTVAARSALEPALARSFANGRLFDMLRIDPFFRHALPRHPRLAGLIELLTGEGTVLVHGDFSPKNVLMDRAGEIRVLDAECACWGHRAFDPGYLLAHLLLKHLHTGNDALLAAAATFWQAYCSAAPAAAPDLEEAVCRVVAAMLIARVDGKSPVEYLGAGAAADARRRGDALLDAPPASLDALLAGWR